MDYDPIPQADPQAHLLGYLAGQAMRAFCDNSLLKELQSQSDAEDLRDKMDLIADRAWQMAYAMMRSGSGPF